MATTGTQIEARKAVARRIVAARFDISNPDLNIKAELDEPGEQIALADLLNHPIAHWVWLNTPLAWLPVHYTEMTSVATVRDVGKIVLAHLVAKPAAVTSLTQHPFGGAA